MSPLQIFVSWDRGGAGIDSNRPHLRVAWNHHTLQVSPHPPSRMAPIAPTGRRPCGGEQVHLRRNRRGICQLQEVAGHQPLGSSSSSRSVRASRQRCSSSRGGLTWLPSSWVTTVTSSIGPRPVIRANRTRAYRLACRRRRASSAAPCRRRSSTWSRSSAVSSPCGRAVHCHWPA